MYAKTECMIDLLYVFTTRQWNFDNSNTRELWSLLSQDDRNTFWYSLEEFDWASYIKVYFYGIRKHVLREELGNVDTATVKNRKYDILIECNFSSIMIYYNIFVFYVLFSDYFGCISYVFLLLFTLLLKYVGRFYSFYTD